MNCEQYQEQISQFIDGELLPTDEMGLFVHLGMCDQCRVFLNNVLSLRNTLTLTRQIAVPVSLDQRVIALFPSAIKRPFIHNVILHSKENLYSIRTLGLAIIFSVLTGVLFSSFFYASKQPQQTIVCITPLPEVEVNGYIVIAPLPMKGIKQ